MTELDRKPVRCVTCSDRFAYGTGTKQHTLVFAPRPQFEQSESAYMKDVLIGEGLSVSAINRAAQ